MILFVCTGNTCRSPMAAALARHLGGIEADSAGLAASPGAAATPAAVSAAADWGADLHSHAAKQVSRELVAAARRVYAMTESHAQYLRALFPDQAAKITAFSPPIPDPFGGDEAVYAHCAQALVSALKREGLVP